jgi:hypothetical protein
MRKISVNLLLAAVDVRSRTVRVAVRQNGALPSAGVGDRPCQATAAALCSDVSRVAARPAPNGPGWLDLRLCGLLETPECVGVVYGAALPEAVPLADAEWVDLGRLPPAEVARLAPLLAELQRRL